MAVVGAGAGGCAILYDSSLVADGEDSDLDRRARRACERVDASKKCRCESRDGIADSTEHGVGRTSREWRLKVFGVEGPLGHCDGRV